MTPYYEQDGIVIYHGDCREILPELEPVDLVLTDPPYPDMKGGITYSFDGVAKTTKTVKTIGVPWGIGLDEWMPEAYALSRLGMMVFCSFHSVPEVASFVPAKDRVALVTWYKNNAPPSIANVPRFTTELVWLFKKAPGLKWRGIKNTMIDVPNLQAGCMSGERFVDTTGSPLHPTQKPVSVIKTLLGVGPASVLDPFMGTGTTLRAAKDLGIPAIGIEANEQYCEIAVRRLQQAVLPLEVLA